MKKYSEKLWRLHGCWVSLSITAFHQIFSSPEIQDTYVQAGWPLLFHVTLRSVTYLFLWSHSLEKKKRSNIKNWQVLCFPKGRTHQHNPFKINTFRAKSWCCYITGDEWGAWLQPQLSKGGKTSCHNPCRRIPKPLEENKHMSIHDTQVTERHSTGQVYQDFPTELLLFKSVTSTTNNSSNSSFRFQATYRTS